jgi:hypothetical protein
MVLTTVGYGSTAPSTAIGKVWGSGGSSWFLTLLAMVPQLHLQQLERYGVLVGPHGSNHCWLWFYSSLYSNWKGMGFWWDLMVQTTVAYGSTAPSTTIGKGSCTNCIGTNCIGTNCIGNKLYREQTVSETYCIRHKLYLVTNCIGAQIVSGTNCMGHTNCIGCQIETTN